MEERRKDYAELRKEIDELINQQERVLVVDKDLRNALIDIIDLKIETTVHIKTAIEHRKMVNDRLQDILTAQNMLDEKIDKFPCDKRESWYKSLTRQVSFMWLVLGGIVFTLFMEITKRRV